MYRLNIRRSETGYAPGRAVAIGVVLSAMCLGAGLVPAMSRPAVADQLQGTVLSGTVSCTRTYQFRTESDSGTSTNVQTTTENDRAVYTLAAGKPVTVAVMVFFKAEVSDSNPQGDGFDDTHTVQGSYAGNVQETDAFSFNLDSTAPQVYDYAIPLTAPSFSLTVTDHQRQTYRSQMIEDRTTLGSEAAHYPDADTPEPLGTVRVGEPEFFGAQSVNIAPNSGQAGGTEQCTWQLQIVSSTNMPGGQASTPSATVSTTPGPPVTQTPAGGTGTAVTQTATSTPTATGVPTPCATAALSLAGQSRSEAYVEDSTNRCVAPSPCITQGAPPGQSPQSSATFNQIIWRGRVTVTTVRRYTICAQVDRNPRQLTVWNVNLTCTMRMKFDIQASPVENMGRYLLTPYVGAAGSLSGTITIAGVNGYKYRGKISFPKNARSMQRVTPVRLPVGPIGTQGGYAIDVPVIDFPIQAEPAGVVLTSGMLAHHCALTGPASSPSGYSTAAIKGANGPTATTQDTQEWQFLANNVRTSGGRSFSFLPATATGLGGDASRLGTASVQWNVCNVASPRCKALPR